MSRSKVAVLRTSPKNVFQDIEKLCALAEIKNHLDPSRTVILKDNLFSLEKLRCLFRTGFPSLEVALTSPLWIKIIPNSRGSADCLIS